MLMRTQKLAGLFGVLAVLLLGWSALASSVTLTVNSYSDLIRFSFQGTVKELRVEILSLSGQTIFDSGTVNSAALDWELATANGRKVAGGVYLYAITAKDTAGKTQQFLGKLALVPGRGQPFSATLIQAGSVSQIAHPQWNNCGSACAEQHNGDVTIATSAGAGWAKFDSTNQRLGIGTTSPTDPLHVMFTSTATSQLWGVHSDIQFNPSAPSSAILAGARIRGYIAPGNIDNHVQVYGEYLQAEAYGSGNVTQIAGLYG